ncbi:MAG: translation initiation factor IF-6 [Methanomicrobiales archaeon]|nr:translation initiation factor IF-6 [Methanomicrobiales archaeon]
MKETIDFAADPHIGVFSRVFEDIAVIPPAAPEPFQAAVREALGVDIVLTTVQGSSIVGSLVAGNSTGIVVSGLVSAGELSLLSEHRDVMRLERSMNAAGNIILCNDEFAALHPDISEKTAEKIGSFLDVRVIRTTLGGIPTVGMAAVATNRGVLVHPRATPQEIAALESVTDLPVGTGSVNMGTGLVGTGLIANSRGYLAGFETSGYELGRIEEVFGFLE